MTKLKEVENFPVIHYLISTILSIAIVCWSLSIPFEDQLSIIQSKSMYAGDYRIYSLFINSEPLLFFIWNIIYAVLGLYRIIRFRKIIVNYSADEQRTSYSWLFQFLMMMLASLPMAVIVIALPEGNRLPFWLILAFVLIFIFKDIIFAHNVLLDNLVIINLDKEEMQGNENVSPADTMVKRGAIRRLENYMHKHKPYLNPKLKITDMTRELMTNRTSLSLLINRTYGMNFSRYVNRFRLQELERIKKDPAYAGYSELKQVMMAGFSDYRGYKRVKQRENIETIF